MSPSVVHSLLGSKPHTGSSLSTGTNAVARPRTRIVTNARLEIPQRPENGIKSESDQTDAFKELVALSKKQSVNRVQDVSL